MSLEKGEIQVRGDFGNPSGSGLAKIVLSNPGGADAAASKTLLATFGAALKTQTFTACNIGDVAVFDKTLNFQLKPGASVNVDRKMEVTFRQTTDASIRSLTIPGVPSPCTLTEDADGGERLTDAGKTALETLLTAVFGFTAGNEAVVLYGKVIQNY